jgi:hypothetical protein
MEFNLIAYSFPILSVFTWMLLVIIYLLIALWPARVAARKGHSFFGFFILSVIFFPLSLLLAYLSADLTHTQHVN